MIISKHNYQDHRITCDECFKQFDGIQAPLEDDPEQKDLWVVRCPGCGEPAIRFWKEDPNFDVIAPDKMEERHWDRVFELYDKLLDEPALLSENNGEQLSTVQYIDKITEPYHEFLYRFSWMEWHEGMYISRPENAYLLLSVPFAKAIALLFTLCRAERFDEGLLQQMINNGQLKKLVWRISYFGS